MNNEFNILGLWDVFIYLLEIIAVIFFIYFIHLHKKKKIKIKNAKLGPFDLEFSDIENEEIENIKKEVEFTDIISMPIAACKNEVLTPPLQIKILDSENNIIKNCSARLEIYGESGLLSSKNISGTISKTSNCEGIVSFDDIHINATGAFIFVIEIGNKEITTDEFNIFPPGLPVDFWNYTVGTPEYESRLERILRFKTTE